MPKALISILFFFSGATALVYQVLWTRQLSLVFGVTLLAISTVLACFFGGLALGSFLGGKWADRRANGFFWYGAAEALIGAYALVFPLAILLNNEVYVLIASRAQLGFSALSVLKFALSALILIVPSTLMGATLPILSRAIASSEGTFAKDIGALYTINTLGAVAGALLAAFVLIPALGLKTLLMGTGVFNIAIGLTAIIAAKSAYRGAGERTKGERVAGQALEQKRTPSFALKLVMAGFALSGFTGLAYEVVWTRLLGFVLTGTVYAFSIVLAVFLTGIALGSLIASRFIDRLKGSFSAVFVFAIVEAGIGLGSIALITLYANLPGFGFYGAIDSTPVWSEFVFLNFLTAFLTLIVPALLFGATFPLVAKICRDGLRVGESIGNIYSLNTIGGIAGSFAGGFLLIPLLGMQKTVVLMGLINVAIGAIVLLSAPSASKRRKLGFIAAVAVLCAIAILTLPQNMALSLHKSLLSTGEQIVFYKEGSSATVMIAERPGAGLSASNKRLWVNGNRATAAYYEGLQINRFQGALPMVLHPDPKEVLVICFGSGTTFGTLSQFPVERVDNVEIASTVIEGAPVFKKENRDVLNNPVSRIIIDDGRSYLAATSKKYDVITQEPMHPALAGVVNLYTKEYYELAKSRLKTNGIVSQWIPLYNVSVEEMKSMVATFQSVFPHTTVWIANTDIFMIGSPEPLRVDLKRLIARTSVPHINALLKDIDLEDPIEFLSTFVMAEDMTRRYTEGYPVMTDDMPTVEFTGPRSLNVNTVSPNIGEFVKFREPVAPYLAEGQLTDELQKRLDQKFLASKYNLVGRAYYGDRNVNMAAEYFRRALDVDPTDRNSIHYLKNFGMIR